MRAEFFSPLDESLQGVCIDLNGEPALQFNTSIPTARVGRYETRLVESFYRNLVTVSPPPTPKSTGLWCPSIQWARTASRARSDVNVLRPQHRFQIQAVVFKGDALRGVDS